MAERESVDDDLLPTGIDGLDELLRGGIRRDNLILVEGETGTGKSIFGTEFVYRGITELGATGTVIHFGGSASKRYRDAASLGWDLESLEREGRLKLIFTSPQVLHEDLLSSSSLLLSVLSGARPHRVFFDGVALLGTLSDGDAGKGPPGIEPIQQLVLTLERLSGDHPGIAVLFSHERLTRRPEPLRRDTLELGEQLADTIIRLRRENGGGPAPTRRTLEVVKSHGQPFDAGQHSLEITPRGIRVYRRVQARVRPPAPPAAAAATGPRRGLGIPLLDELFVGGIDPGSITLVAGPTGSGKSVLAAQWIEAGARSEHERGLLVSLGEPEAQILRNAASSGIALEEAVDRGLAQVLHESSQELDIHAHFHAIRKIVEQTDVRRLVIDDLTSYRSAIGDERLFCDFFQALTGFTRQRAVTTFLNDEGPEIFGPSRTLPSDALRSLADNLVMLHVVESRGELRRSLRVVKARGVRHSLARRPFQIGAGGLQRLEEPGL